MFFVFLLFILFFNSFFFSFIDRIITFICVRKLHEHEQVLLDALVKERKGEPSGPAEGVNYARLNSNLRAKEGKKTEASVNDLRSRLDQSTNIGLPSSRRMGGGRGDQF